MSRTSSSLSHPGGLLSIWTSPKFCHIVNSKTQNPVSPNLADIENVLKAKEIWSQMVTNSVQKYFHSSIKNEKEITILKLSL